MYDDVKAHLQEMLDISAIRKSYSPWVSAVILVQKKEGSLRFCIDLRKLNNWTVEDAYSLPCINDTINSLQGLQWFFSLDLKSGYWQVKMDNESRLLTSLTVGLLGFYKCDRMFLQISQWPYNLSAVNGEHLRDLNLNWYIIYLDDVVIFLKDPASHLERLEAVLQKLEQAGLKLKLSKCDLFQLADYLPGAYHLCPRNSH